MKIYIVFENSIATYDYKEEKFLATQSDFSGAYDNLKDAVERCKNDTYWIGAAIIGEHVPEKRLTWQESYDHEGKPSIEGRR